MHFSLLFQMTQTLSAMIWSVLHELFSLSVPLCSVSVPASRTPVLLTPSWWRHVSTTAALHTSASAPTPPVLSSWNAGRECSQFQDTEETNSQVVAARNITMMVRKKIAGMIGGGKITANVVFLMLLLWLLFSDINECGIRAENLCSDTCVNEDGTHSCACMNGQTLASDGHHCGGRCKTWRESGKGWVIQQTEGYVYVAKTRYWMEVMGNNR